MHWGGVKAVPLKEKKSDGEVPTAIKLEKEGVKVLIALPLKKKCGFPKERA